MIGEKKGMTFNDLLEVTYFWQFLFATGTSEHKLSKVSLNDSISSLYSSFLCSFSDLYNVRSYFDETPFAVIYSRVKKKKHSLDYTQHCEHDDLICIRWALSLFLSLLLCACLECTH